jgi:hypothetical protein
LDDKCEMQIERREKKDVLQPYDITPNGGTMMSWKRYILKDDLINMLKK